MYQTLWFHPRIINFRAVPSVRLKKKQLIVYIVLKKWEIFIFAFSIPLAHTARPRHTANERIHLCIVFEPAHLRRKTVSVIYPKPNPNMHSTEPISSPRSSTFTSLVSEPR
jgi:hypothetical protein